MTSSAISDCTLTPSGKISVVTSPDDSIHVEHLKLKALFSEDSAAALLHLGAMREPPRLGPGLAYLRALSRGFLGSLCTRLDATLPAPLGLPEFQEHVLSHFIECVPPMKGAELIDARMLRQLWEQLGSAANRAAASRPTGFEGYLQETGSDLQVAGRVCLHVAENPLNQELPFAFLATYRCRVPGSSKTRNVPLAQALQEYAEAQDRFQLVELLSPLQRAAAVSPLVRELMDTGNIYHPLAWTSDQALQLLLQADSLAAAGLQLRLPEWWNQGAPPRPQVRVTLGAQQPAGFGIEALLDFQVEISLGGASLSQAEVDELLRGPSGLLKTRAGWLHVDPEPLRRSMELWMARKFAHAERGMHMAAGLRELAGLQLPGTPSTEPTELQAWSHVEAGAWLGNQLSALRSPQVLAAIEEHAGLSAELRPYQKLGVQWLWTLKGLGLGGCLADDMGLGKTIQVIGLFSLLKAERCSGQAEPHTDLLVVPASLLTNWQEELTRFAPHLRVIIAHPSCIPARRLKHLTPSEIEAYDVVITSYATALRLPWIEARTWRCLVLDEAQAIKNPRTRQTRAIKRIEAHWRLALTGTPIENKLQDLWSIFDFLNPGLLGNASQFASCTRAMPQAGESAYGPLRRIVQPYTLRRLKTDQSIISDLPEKSELTAYCLLSKAQAALYREAVAELGQSVQESEGIQRRGLILSFLLRLKQICNHPSHWLGHDEFEPAESGKFERLGELADAIAERQEKLLVFTQFAKLARPLSEFLAQRFGASGIVLTGRTPIKSRQSIVRTFQSSEDVPFMVLSLKAGGSGLNLTAANHVVHFDRWWNPAVENQATDRAFRIGQKRNVLVHKFVCKGTIEERIDRLIAGKQQLSEEVLQGGAEKQLTELSDDELMSMVQLDLESAVRA